MARRFAQSAPLKAFLFAPDPPFVNFRETVNTHFGLISPVHLGSRRAVQTLLQANNLQLACHTRAKSIYRCHPQPKPECLSIPMLSALSSMLPMPDVVRRPSVDKSDVQRRGSKGVGTKAVEPLDATTIHYPSGSPPSLPASPVSNNADKDLSSAPPPLQLTVAYSVKRPSQSQYYRGIVRRPNAGAFAQPSVPTGS